MPVPTFSMYRHIALTMGWRVEEVPLGAGFALDEAALAARAAAAAPRLSVFASPNNPTGNLFDRGVLERYLAAAPGVVVIDEAYHDFAGASAVPLLERHPNLVVLQTLSKIGLAALRLGILLASPELARELNKVRLPYNVGAFPQAAARVVLEDAGVPRGAAADDPRRARAAGRGAGRSPAGVTVFPSDANFLLFRTPWASRAVFEGLRSRGVLVRDLGGHPGPLQGCLRVTVGTPEENTAFLEALPHALAGRLGCRRVTGSCGRERVGQVRDFAQFARWNLPADQHAQIPTC